MSDWADSETHDYLNEWVGRRIVAVTTGEREYYGDFQRWLAFTFEDGRTVEVEGSMYHGDAWLTVQDVES